MSHFRRSSKPIKQSQSFAIQAEPPQSPLDLNDLLPVESAELAPVSSSLIKKEKVESLISTISKVENESRIQQEQEERKRRQRVPMRKSVDINLMKIKNESYRIDKNIYNVTVGQLFSKESYLNNLSTKINSLKTKINQLQDQQEKMNMTLEKEISLQHRSVDYSERSMTINSAQLKTGKLYNRNQNTLSSRKKFKGSHPQERSSYYQWRPQLEYPEQLEQAKPVFQPKPIKNTRYFDESSTSQAIKDGKSKNYINYRVKQKSNAPLSSKGDISEPGSAPRKSKQAIKLDPRGLKTEQFSHFQTQKTENNPEDCKRSKSHKLSEDVLLEVYDGILFGDVSQFEIKDLNDDFRQKITQQLDIPKGFPAKSPELGMTIDQVEALGPQYFTLFGLQVEKEKKKLKSRKFKNGVYYHLDQNKNILWYYSGSYYIGGWDSELPTEGQKKGMGFQYIPDKFFYRGQFKDGVKEGHGVIKLFPSNPQQPEDFMAYEGQWKNGKPHGFGKHIDEKGTKYIGFFVAGEKTGSATIITKQGIWYKGEVLKGVKHGSGTQKLVNGDCYIGQFQNGNFHGQGSYKWKNSSIYEGQFFKGKRQGRGIWKGTKGDIFEGEYHSDLKNGWGKFVWTNGQIYQGQFKDDIRHGEGSYKHPNGKLGKFMWKEGQIDYRIYSKQEEHYRCRNIEDRRDEELEQ